MFPVNLRFPWVQCNCSWFAVDQDSLERIQSFGRYFLSTCFVQGPGLGTGRGRRVKVPIEEWTPEWCGGLEVSREQGEVACTQSHP